MLAILFYHEHTVSVTSERGFEGSAEVDEPSVHEAHKRCRVKDLVFGIEGSVDAITGGAGFDERDDIRVKHGPPVVLKEQVLSAFDAKVASGGVNALQNVRTVLRPGNQA